MWCSTPATARPDESSEVLWVPVSEVGDYQMDPSMRLRVRRYIEHHDQPYIG
jgi:hypothetical protein